MTSPWNPKGDAPTWVYTVCGDCGLRYETQKHVPCPRCRASDRVSAELKGYEFGGFLAVRDDTPVLEEEDRFSITSLLQCFLRRPGRRPLSTYHRLVRGTAP